VVSAIHYWGNSYQPVLYTTSQSLLLVIKLRILNLSRDDSRSIKKVLKQAGVVHNTKPQQNN